MSTSEQCVAVQVCLVPEVSNMNRQEVVLKFSPANKSDKPNSPYCNIVSVCDTMIIPMMQSVMYNSPSNPSNPIIYSPSKPVISSPSPTRK